MPTPDVVISYDLANKIAQILGQAPAGAVAEPFLALVSAIRSAEPKPDPKPAPASEQ